MYILPYTENLSDLDFGLSHSLKIKTLMVQLKFPCMISY